MTEDRLAESLGAALNKSVVLSFLEQSVWPKVAPKPRPWYRRLWYRIDRYLPRVSVRLGPTDA